MRAGSPCRACAVIQPRHIMNIYGYPPPCAFWLALLPVFCLRADVCGQLNYYRASSLSVDAQSAPTGPLQQWTEVRAEEPHPPLPEFLGDILRKLLGFVLSGGLKKRLKHHCSSWGRQREDCAESWAWWAIFFKRVIINHTFCTNSHLNLITQQIGQFRTIIPKSSSVCFK